MNRPLRTLLWATSIASALFVFLAIQYSAITVPFWDHCELGKLLIRSHDHGFEWPYLWAAHNQHRILTYRSLFVLNAYLTNWDIRSEYVYLLAVMYGAFLLQGWTMWRIGERKNDNWLAGVIAILAIFSFSPVGHNNHWWSFMIALHFAHLFVAGALISIAIRPTAWTHNVVSSILCWLAAYSLGTGLLAFIVAGAISQYGSGRVWRLSARTVFWVLNLIVVLALYLPGMPHEAGALRPGPATMIWFALVYLGFPVVSLIRYPYTEQFQLAGGMITLVNGTAGALLCGVAAWLAWFRRDDIRARTHGALCFLGFVAFSVASAFMTAWGRAAFDAQGVANANSSRYVLFSSYLVYGALYLLVSRGVRDSLRPRQPQLIGAVLVCFIAVAANAYTQSIDIYRQAHDFNLKLIRAYTEERSSDDASIYPNPQVVAELKQGLRRLSIGPYRGRIQEVPTTLDELASHALEDSFHINGIRQDPSLGKILFAHPHSQFFLPLSNQPKTLSVSYGISGGALLVKPPTDGVEFRISLDRKGETVALWSRYLDPAKVPADRARQQISLSLDAPEGSRLIFETAPGATSTADWAYWADLILRN